VSEAVGLTPDGEVGSSQGALDGIDQLMMWDGVPRLGGPWSVDPGHLIEWHSGSPAMEQEVAFVSHRMDSFRLVVLIPSGTQRVGGLTRQRPGLRRAIDVRLFR
jgi:hypothetical protein